MGACMCICVFVCVLVHVCVRMCDGACMAAYMFALPPLWLKSKYRISWARDTRRFACGAIPDDNADANHRYFVHLHITCI